MEPNQNATAAQRLAAAVREALDAKGWTDSEAARRAEMSPTTMAAVLHARQLPKPKTLVKLDRLFDWPSGTSRLVLEGRKPAEAVGSLVAMYQTVRDFAAECERLGVPQAGVYAFLAEAARMFDTARSLEAGGEVRPVTAAELAAQPERFVVIPR